MDGNRRWAKERGLPSFEGHRAGYELVKKLGPWCLARGVKVLTFYAFSVDNWKRASDEVGFLMDLLMQAITKDLDILSRDGIRLKVIGRRADLSPKIQQAIAEAEAKTKNNSAGTMQLAISYGGRDEIVRAVQDAVSSSFLLSQPESWNPRSSVTEETISQHLDTAGLPDPDLIIRTSGEQRLSGFLLWQAAYSELLFVNKYWPDFSESDLDASLAWYADRERRYGK
jgi:undecaprenyl diphosphate synthase